MAISACSQCGQEYDSGQLEKCPECGASRSAAGDRATAIPPPNPGIPSETQAADVALKYQRAEIERLNQVIGLLQQQSAVLREQNAWLRKIRGWLVFLWFGLVFVPGLLGLLILAAIAGSQ